MSLDDIITSRGAARISVARSPSGQTANCLAPARAASSQTLFTAAICPNHDNPRHTTMSKGRITTNATADDEPLWLSMVPHPLWYFAEWPSHNTRRICTDQHHVMRKNRQCPPLAAHGLPCMFECRRECGAQFPVLLIPCVAAHGVHAQCPVEIQTLGYCPDCLFLHEYVRRVQPVEHVNENEIELFLASEFQDDRFCFFHEYFRVIRQIEMFPSCAYLPRSFLSRPVPHPASNADGMKERPPPTEHQKPTHIAYVLQQTGNPVTERAHARAGGHQSSAGLQWGLTGYVFGWVPA